MVLFELINVIISNLSKWLKSGKTNQSRQMGFYISLIIAVSWSIYFYLCKQYWLSGNALVVFLLAGRGVLNNKGNTDA